MFPLLRQRPFALLWLGGLISLAGDWMLRIALPIYVYQLTGSPLATSAIFMAGMLPRLLLGSLAGVFVDRWDRRRTMIVANLLLALGLLPLLAVRSTELLWIVYVVAFVESCITQFFEPAENALLPRLVGEEHLVEANSLNALNNNLARLIGPPLGGLIAGLLGLTGVALVDAATFLVAAALIGLIRVDGRPARPLSVDATTLAARTWTLVWREWLEGLRLVWRERQVAIIFVILAATALGEGVFSVLFVLFVNTILGGGAQELGWLMGAQAIGGLLGGALIGALGAGLAPARLLGFSGIIFGMLDLALFNYPAFYPGFAPAVMLLILVGVPAVGFGTSVNTLLQTSVDDRYRGRIFGALNTTSALLSLVGIALAGLLSGRLGVITMLNIQGSVYVFAGLIALALLGGARALRREQAASHGAIADRL